MMEGSIRTGWHRDREKEQQKKRERDSIKNVLSLFFQKFHTVTTSTPTTGNPPKTVPSQPLYLPCLPPYPSILHLQLLLALTLNLDLKHLPYGCQRNGLLSTVRVAINTAGDGHCQRGAVCTGSRCHHHLQSFSLPIRLL